MKGTKKFEETIKAYLDNHATKDATFAIKYTDPNKSIEDCLTYILNQVKNSGCNGFDDSEIYGMALHYYDEANVEIGEPISGQVVVNHHVEITEEEKAEAKAKALDELIAKEKNKLQQQKNAKQTPTTEQPSLF